jgi:mannose/cellobiose epimerase-like protein (N-acyl-D-glucosamine 2-epimerase family)
VAFNMIDTAFERLKDWLFCESLPLWQEHGIDHKNGGFFERLDSSARPIVDIPRRTRVVARQIYSFAAAGRLGWPGDWREVVDHGASSLFEVCMKPDGLVVSTYSADEAQANSEFDLYDHAFVLFALAELARTDSWAERACLAAINMLKEMNARFMAPKGGWLDSEGEVAILRSNPHMHLLEAMLALESATNMNVWRYQADSIVDLASRFFIAPKTGALHEYFNLDWEFYPDDRGRIVEPGHQFEWSWLLHKWCQQSEKIVPEIAAIADKLCAIGEQHGVTKTGMVIDELWSDMTVKEQTSRTWPQTERAKACVMQAALATDPQTVAVWEARAANAIDSILCFTHQIGHKGLWYDRLLPNGQPMMESAPASTLYHIMCTAEVVDMYLKQS